jgi:hypothetical protein
MVKDPGADMRDSADFRDSESLVEEARFAYSEIYYWHAADGRRKFDERFREREESEGRRTKYLALVVELVEPKRASTRDMLHVAREVLSGRMEWAYHEKSEQGITLSNWARRIQELLQEHEKRLAHEQVAKQLKAFRSLTTDGTVADAVRIEIPIQDDEPWSLERYLAYANSAYNDVPQTDKIGGKIFLIQTNLERTHDSQSYANRSGYIFHNAKLLHVETIAGEHNLLQLIRDGDLFVESVILGE